MGLQTSQLNAEKRGGKKPNEPCFFFEEYNPF